MDCLKVSAVSFNKQLKGILLHSGFLFMQDIIDHQEADYTTLQTEPSLTDEQRYLLKTEVIRIQSLFDQIQEMGPLDFKFKQSDQMLKNQNDIRYAIPLMKELSQMPSIAGHNINDEDNNFLDSIFGLGELIELCGLSSCGKSQICFQLALNVQIPQAIGGVSASMPGQALFVDCHGDFSNERLSEMAKHLRQNVLKQIEKNQDLLKRYKEEFQISSIHQKIHYVRLLDEGELQLLHMKIADVVKKLPNLKFICFDTFSEHLRGSELNYGDRKRLVSEILINLQRIAHQHDICVVVINNMRPGKRTEFFQNQNQPYMDQMGQDAGFGQQQMPSGPTKPEPLFGEDLFQTVTSRVMLERDQHSTEENCIRAKLIKGSIATGFTAHPTAHFLITEKGISNII